MDRYELTESVVVEGPNFWGRRSRLVLEPIDKPGWYWRTKGEDVLITPKLLRYRQNRLVLEHGRSRLNVYEHIGAFRFLGLDSVCIHSDPWPPYDGCGKELGEKISFKLRRHGSISAWSCAGGTASAGRAAAVGFSPSHDTLTVDVYIDYRGLGDLSAAWDFPHNSFDRFASVRAPGWGLGRKPVAWLMSKLGWPHYRHVNWPDFSEKEKTLESFALHRTFDILGALSVLPPPGHILSGKFFSQCAGHKEDVALVREISCASAEYLITARAAE